MRTPLGTVPEQTVMKKYPPITITLTRPVPPTVKAAIDDLRETFPDAMTQPPRPLAEGVLTVAQEKLAEQHSKKAVRRALATWCNQADYLRAVVAENAHCVHLDGSDAGPVPSTQREAAQRRLDLKEAYATAPPEPRRTAPQRRPRSAPSDRQTGADQRPPDSGPRISVRQRPKLDKSLIDSVATKPTPSTQRPKLSLKKKSSEPSS